MSDLRKHMDCMPDGCLVGDGQCPVLGQVPWPGPRIPPIDHVTIHAGCRYADGYEAAKWEDRDIDQDADWRARKQIADRIESEFADDPWIFNQIRDEAERQLATHIKDMAIRVARGDIDD
jgi:LmbE family N-acetylglucosaminyl deacetylase